jgi:hypothetical protein
MLSKISAWNSPRWFASLGFVLCHAGICLAQTPTALLSNVVPCGGKVGATFEVTVTGANLDEGEKLLFSHPGITAKPKENPPNEFNPQAQKAPGQFIVTVPGDVPVGLYEVRHVGRYGATNPRVFAVGALSEELEKGDNTSREKAQELTLGSTVTGKADPGNFDYYALNLKAGQRIVLDCLAQRLDSKLNATLILLGTDGRELTRALDVEGLDPVLDFTAPSEGRYVVAVYDFVYNGGPDYFYRLSASSAPYIDFIFPPSGPAGTNQAFTLYGRNLPGGQPAEGLQVGNAPLQKLTVNIPIPGDEAARTSSAVSGAAFLRSMLVDSFLYKLNSPQGDSNSVPVGIAQGAILPEQEPNNNAAQAQKITLPGELVGQFYPQRDEDWYQFEAKKGEVWVFDVAAHRLGRNCDPMLLLQKITKNDKGEEQAADVAFVDDPQDRTNRIGVEYDTSSDDPSYKLAVPEDGVYRVMIRDQFGDGRQDPRFVYRLAIRKPEPDFRVAVFPDTPTAAKQDNVISTDIFVLPKGGTAMLRVTVDRRDDFDGEIEIAVEGLPAGVTCAGALLGGKGESSTLVIAANDSAAAWAGPIRVIAKANVNGQVKTRMAGAGTLVWNVANKQNETVRTRAMRDLVLCVTDKEPAPVFLQAGDGQVIETALGGKLELPITVTRRGSQLKDPLKLSLLGFSKDVKAKDLTIDNSKNDGKVEVELSQPTLKPGAYTFCIKGDSKVNYARNPELVVATEAEQKRVSDGLQMLADKQKQATAARDQAMKAVQEAKTQLQQLEKQRDALKAEDPARKDAEAKAAEGQTKVTQATEMLASAEKMVAELTEKTKQGMALKTQVDARLADAKKNAAPKDVAVSYVSTGVKLRIHAAPIKLELPPELGTIKAGEKKEVSVSIVRMFNFKDAVELTLEPPAGVAGLANAKISIPADQTSGKVEFMPQKNAPAGSHTFTVKAKGKFGSVNFESVGQAILKIEAAP